MRSARVVSSVMRMMLGCAELGRAPRFCEEHGVPVTAKQTTSKITSTARNRKTRIRKWESSIARLPGYFARIIGQKTILSEKFILRGPPWAITGIADSNVVRFRDLTKSTAVQGVVGEVVEIGVIEDVVYLPAKFDVHAFRRVCVLLIRLTSHWLRPGPIS